MADKQQTTEQKTKTLLMPVLSIIGLGGIFAILLSIGSSTARYYGCGASPLLSVCGNGILQIGEQCDDGNVTNTDSCSTECKACYQSGAGFDNRTSLIGTQNNIFTLEYDAIPFGDSIDALTMLSSGAGTTWGDYDVLVRFFTNGMLEARNGNAYMADAPITYTSSTMYHFRLAINVPASSYSVFVTPDGGVEKLLAKDYAFRNGTSTGILTNIAFQAGAGAHSVCNIKVTHEPMKLCGNGILDTGEMCDDGNTLNNDGCSESCSSEIPSTVSGYLTNTEHLTLFKTQADAGIEPFQSHRNELVAIADSSWNFGMATGTYETFTINGTTKKCRINNDPLTEDFLKEGPDQIYAKVLAYHLTGNESYAVEAREKLLLFSQTSGFGTAYSGSNQCVLNASLAAPVLIEAARLLEGTPIWSISDQQAFASWLATYVYPKSAWVSRVSRNNWGAAGSLASSLIADYVKELVISLQEVSPTMQTITPDQAYDDHIAMQKLRMGTTWQGTSNSGCDIGDIGVNHFGIQDDGGIPDELRRGSTGCLGTYIVDEDASYAYTHLHTQLLTYHAEALHNLGDDSLYEFTTATGNQALQQAALFVIDNKSGTSWPWDDAEMGVLYVLYDYYQDSRIVDAIDENTSFRAGRQLPYARITHPLSQP